MKKEIGYLIKMPLQVLSFHIMAFHIMPLQLMPLQRTLLHIQYRNLLMLNKEIWNQKVGNDFVCSQSQGKNSRYDQQKVVEFGRTNGKTGCTSIRNRYGCQAEDPLKVRGYHVLYDRWIANDVGGVCIANSAYVFVGIPIDIGSFRSIRSNHVDVA